MSQEGRELVEHLLLLQGRQRQETIGRVSLGSNVDRDHRQLLPLAVEVGEEERVVLLNRSAKCETALLRVFGAEAVADRSAVARTHTRQTLRAVAQKVRP